MNRTWIRNLFAELRPAMTPGVYVNFMSGDEDDRVSEAYRERWERLVAVKTQYDPNNFLRLNQNIRPQPGYWERASFLRVSIFRRLGGRKEIIRDASGTAASTNDDV